MDLESIPGTPYQIERFDHGEVAMGLPSCSIRLIDAGGASPDVEFPGWRFIDSPRAIRLISQDPPILLLTAWVLEMDRRGAIKDQKTHSLKLDLVQRRFRIAERDEPATSIDHTFYPLDGLPKLLAFLQTHIHGRKARKTQSKFH